MKRRHFTGIILSGAAYSLLPLPLFANSSETDYPFQSLDAAFKSINFDPDKEGNSFFVVTADVHYGQKGTDGMIATVNEVNKMNPLPAFYCVNGDMICSASLSFGVIPDEQQRQDAIKEFRAFKKDADELNRRIKLVLSLGNHDTYPGETEAGLFHEVFPGYPVYQSFNNSGVHIIVLNGHSTGDIDSKQMEWLVNDVKSIPKDQTVIVFVHQPSMSHRANERGIPKAISEAFEKHRGLVWLIGGHEHHNAQEVFRLKHTKLIEHQITCGTANLWGGPEHPGYWIYCLQDGKVAGRIFRQQFNGYRTEPFPDLSKAVKVPVPFDNFDNILWKTFVGDDKDYLIYADAGDCLSFWAYAKELVYRMPLKETSNRSAKIVMLCHYIKMNDIHKTGQYFVSSDQKEWQQIALQKAEFETMTFEIPHNLRQAENIYFKFTPDGEAMVAGFALIR